MRSTRRTVSASKPAAMIVVGRLVQLDVALQDVVEDVVGRQRILIGLVRPQFGRRRLRQDRLGNHRPRRACRSATAPSRYTIVFGTSAMTARPPDMSP